MSTSIEKDAIVLERNKWLERFLIGLTALCVLTGLWQSFAHHGFAVGLFVMSIPLGFWRRVRRDNWRARPRNARVRASAEGIFVDGVRVVDPKDIGHALVQPRAGKKPTVRLQDAKRRVLFEQVVEDEAEGVELLRAIGHDAGARKAQFEALSPFLSTEHRASGTVFATFIAAIVATLFATNLHLHGLTSFLPIIVSMLPMFLVMRRMEVQIGADGISTRWNGRRRFIPFEDVYAVDTSASDGVRIVLRSGKPIDLRTGGKSGWGGAKERATMMRDALAQRIRQAMEAQRARIGPRELAAQLARGDRDETTWLSELKKLRDGEGGYRAAAVREEDLWRVVEDPGAPEEARAGAAILLRSADGARPRLRIAAEAVASPRLRVALEAEEEEDAEEALKAYLS